jgi:hypothetical protein
MEAGTLAHGLVLFIHILLFVYWLGGDVGVFYSSGFVVNPNLSRDARLTAAKIFINLDLIPRICLAAMLTVGGILSAQIGLEHPPWLWAAILLLGPVWVTVVLILHLREGTNFARKLSRVDFWFRWLVIASIIASVTYALSTGRLDGYGWLAAKLLIFAGLIFCGLMVRVVIPEFMQGFHTLIKSGATPESDQQMIRGLGRARPWVLLIWFGVALEALIGILQPGGG